MQNAALNEKEKNIVRHIFSLHTTTRQELCAYTRYTLPTVYRITDDLLRRKIITVSGIAEETIKGRVQQVRNAVREHGVLHSGADPSSDNLF